MGGSKSRACGAFQIRTVTLIISDDLLYYITWVKLSFFPCRETKTRDRLPNNYLFSIENTHLFVHFSFSYTSNLCDMFLSSCLSQGLPCPDHDGVRSPLQFNRAWCLKWLNIVGPPHSMLGPLLENFLDPCMSKRFVYTKRVAKCFVKKKFKMPK